MGLAVWQRKNGVTQTLQTKIFIKLLRLISGFFLLTWCDFSSFATRSIHLIGHLKSRMVLLAGQRQKMALRSNLKLRLPKSYLDLIKGL